MRVVIDANVLFRTLISRGNIFELFLNDSLELFAPEQLKKEFLNNEREIWLKSKLSKDEFKALSEALFKRITFVRLEEYVSLIPRAKQLLGSHNKDEDFVALSISMHTKLWTYESLLFDIGIAISTKELSKELA